MAFTRIIQSGAEVQHVNELEEEVTTGLTSAAISNTKARTGSYSYSVTANTRSRGKAFASTTQISGGLFVNHNGLGGSGTTTRWAYIFLIKSTVDILVAWNLTTNTLDIVVNGTVVATISAATGGFSTTDTWHHIGVACKANAATGFVSVYLNGVQILTYSGNTGTGITAVYFGGRTSSSGSYWNTTAYFDDFYVDDAVGEADAAPHSYRFDWVNANAAGDAAGWSAIGATPEYNCVDDGVPNDDTDYAEAASAGLISYYNMANITLPVGHIITALIPVAWARRTDAGVNSQIKVGARLSSTNTTNATRTITTAYGPAWQRHTTKPGGGSWGETDVNNAQFMAESAGSF